MIAINTDEKNHAFQQLEITAKGGSFWKRLVRIALAVIEEFPFVGDMAAELISDIGVGNGQDIGDWSTSGKSDQTIYNPTASEERIIEAWVVNKFNLFYKKLAGDLSNAFTSGDLNTQLAGINKALSKMAVVSQYFANNETAGLSVDAIKFRGDLIVELFNPILELIDQSISENAFQLQSVTVKPSLSDYAPLNVGGGTYTVENYVVEPGKTPTTPIVPVSTAQPTTPNTTTANTATPGNGQRFFKAASIGLLVLALWPKSKNKNKE